MPESSVTASGASIAVFVDPSGFDRQVTVVGDATAANTQAVDASGAAAVVVSDTTASGTISAINSVPAGTASANSAVEITLNGRAGLTIQVTGTYTTAITLQGTVDGTNWVTIANAPMLNVNSGAVSSTIASATVGIWQANLAGFQKGRLTFLSTPTGSAVITLRASEASGLVTLGQNLPALATGVNTIGKITPVGNATGGATNYNAQSTGATTVGINIKSTSGNVYGIQASNNSATVAFLKLYSKATAPTVGTDTPVYVVLLPANSTTNVPFPVGMAVGSGIGIGLTGLVANTDTTAVPSGNVVVNVQYT